MAFVDNHDNQRGHGGGTSVLTHKESYNYKLATGYNLAHSYGFKRIMSSYYFDDSDDGPPSADAGDRCFHEWVCEHRWSSIMNMVQVIFFYGGDFFAFY